LVAKIVVGQHNCPNQSNGAINATVTGGVPPFKYKWSDVGYFGAPNRVSLAGGLYKVTVTDYCGATSVAQISLVPLLVIESVESGCKDEGSAIITVRYGNPDFTYNWSNGSTGSIVSGLATGLYGLTVSDAIGCTRSTYVTVQNKEYEIIAKASCQNLQSGALEINISNPDEGFVDVKVNDGSIYTSNNAPIYVSLNHGGLPVDYNYKISISIDGCDYTLDKQTIAASKTAREFVAFNPTGKDAGICVYQEFCDGQPIDGSIIEEEAAFDYYDPANCYLPLKCGSKLIKNVPFGLRRLRGSEYLRMLSLVKSGSGYNYSDTQLDLVSEDAKDVKPCDEIYYCPTTLEIINHIYHNNTYTGNLHTYGDDCYWRLCGLLPVTYCDESLLNSNPVVVVFNEGFFDGSEVNTCEAVRYSLLELINWQSEIKAKYPEFESSDLYNNYVLEYDAHIDPNNPNNFFEQDPRVRCFFITFCTSEKRRFEILGDPQINNVVCDPIDIDCTINNEVVNNTIVYCVDPNAFFSTFTICYDEFGSGDCETMTFNGFTYVIGEFPGFPEFTGSPSEYRQVTSEGIYEDNKIKNSEFISVVVNPNPFSNFVTFDIKVKTKAVFDYELTDLNGKSIKKDSYDFESGDYKVQIEINEDLPSGFYFLNISDDKFFQKTIKLIKI
jgi:SprB repeat/Secretion system C-terminal sorting domain